jgi:hypothetical protein
MTRPVRCTLAYPSARVFHGEPERPSSKPFHARFTYTMSRGLLDNAAVAGISHDRHTVIRENMAGPGM